MFSGPRRHVPGTSSTSSRDLVPTYRSPTAVGRTGVELLSIAAFFGERAGTRLQSFGGCGHAAWTAAATKLEDSTPGVADASKPSQARSAPTPWLDTYRTVQLHRGTWSTP
ncbi:hypothetical protein PMIN07_009700 [Paraphaeosphaeria minitans]